MGVQQNKKLDHVDINGQFCSLAEASGAFLLRLYLPCMSSAIAIAFWERQKSYYFV